MNGGRLALIVVVVLIGDSNHVTIHQKHRRLSCATLSVVAVNLNRSNPVGPRTGSRGHHNEEFRPSKSFRQGLTPSSSTRSLPAPPESRHPCHASIPSMELVIRNFQPGDEDAFRLLNEEWIERYFRLEDKDRETLSHPEKILDAGGEIVMALLGEERVGCCALIPIGTDEYEIAKMTVTDKYRGRGFGRAVLAGTIEEARRMGANRLYLETNSSLTPAITLYESLGFCHLPAERIVPSPYARADVYMELFL